MFLNVKYKYIGSYKTFIASAEIEGGIESFEDPKILNAISGFPEFFKIMEEGNPDIEIVDSVITEYNLQNELQNSII